MLNNMNNYWILNHITKDGGTKYSVKSSNWKANPEPANDPMRTSGDYDPNLFLDAQYHNDNLSWILFAQPWVEVGDSVADGNPPDNTFNEVVLRGIVEDPNIGFSGTHTFSEGSIPVLGDWMKTIADTVNDISSKGAATKSFFDEISRRINNTSVAENAKNLINSTIGSASSGLANGINKVVDYVDKNMGSQFITSFDHIKVYKGTDLQVDYGSLSTRIYYKQWNKLGTKDVVKLLLYRFVGGLNPPGTSGTLLDEVIGLQRPPNGYIPQFYNLGIGDRIPGSFVLQYCGHRIPNLLVNSFNWKFSTLKVRTSGGTLVNGNTNMYKITEDNDPLYVDVSIELIPATRMSREIMDWVMQTRNNTNSDSGSTGKTTKNMA